MGSDNLVVEILRHVRREIMRHLGLVQGAAFEERPRSSGRRIYRSTGYASPHPLAEEYRTLGVPIGSDFATVRAGWIRLVREHHPDRWTHDSARQKHSSDRLIQINAAYRKLRSHLQA